MSSGSSVTTEYEKGMQIGFALANSFLKFIEELNELFGKYRDLYEESTAMKSVLERIRTASMKMEERQRMSPSELLSESEIDDFNKKVLDLLNRREPPLDETLKKDINDALDRFMTSCTNFRNEQSFEEFFENLPDMTHAERELAKYYLQDALEGAEKNGELFNLYQTTVFTDPARSKNIVENVEDSLRDRGVLCHGIYDKNSTSMSCILCYSREAQFLAKSLCEYELCKSQMNLVSEESVLMIAKATGQDALRYNGLSKAAASVFEQEVFRKSIPAYTEPSPDGSWSVGSTSRNRRETERAIAIAIAQTEGYSRECGYAGFQEMRLNQIQDALAFSAELPMMNAGSFGIYMDSSSTLGNEHYLIMENGRVREYTVKDDKLIPGASVTKDENPTMYGQRVETLIKNFSQGGMFISGNDLKAKYGIEPQPDKPVIPMTKEIRNDLDTLYNRDLWQKSHESGLTEKAAVEREFLEFCIKTSGSREPDEIFNSISRNLDSYSGRFLSQKKYELLQPAKTIGADAAEENEMLKIYSDFCSSLERGNIGRKEMTAHLEAMSRQAEVHITENLSRMPFEEIDSIVTVTEEEQKAIRDYGKTLETLEKRIKEYDAESIDKTSEKPKARETQKSLRMKAQPYREKSETPYWRSREVPYLDRTMPESYRAKTVEDYRKEALDYGRALRKQNPHVNQERISSAATKFVIKEDVINMIKYDADPVLGKDSVECYKRINRSYMEKTGKAIYELTNDELKAELPKINGIANDVLGLSKAIEKEKRQNQDQER